MEQKEDILDSQIVEKLKGIQDEQNNMVIALGQVAVRRRDLQRQLEELEEKEIEFGLRIDKSINEMNIELGELDKKYPNGQIDLEKGVIYY
jgi:predicted site-specific integrase-resolvase